MATISYKNIMRIACFAVAAALMLVAVIIWNADKAAKYRRHLENAITYSLREAASGISTLSIDLKKSSYAGTPAQISEISAKVWKESGTVKAALENLPAGAIRLDSTYRFLSQVGDYSMYLGRRSANGLVPSDEDRENVDKLMEYSTLLMDNLLDLERMVSSGEISAAGLIDAGGELPLREMDTSGFESVEKSFEGYPMLIYDGPFSDHLMEREPVITKEQPEITRERAREIAAQYAGVDAATLLNGGDEVSNMPSYTFYNSGVTVGVTISGGYVTYLSGSRMAGEKTLTIEQGREKAQKYLERQGFYSMTETYYELASGVLTVNFAYQHGNVICYTDLIKVGVAMDDGQVIFYDARSFINNHRERSPLEPAIPPEVALKSVSQSLDIQSFRPALIPTAGKNEVLTWEFLCRGRHDENVLVYINSETAAEEQILILIESENGVLTA